MHVQNHVHYFVQAAGSYTMTFVLSSLSASSTSLNCSSSSDSSPASITYTRTLTSSQLSEGYTVVDSVCLSSSATYQLIVYHTSNTPLLLDSVSARIVFLQILLVAIISISSLFQFFPHIYIFFFFPILALT